MPKFVFSDEEGALVKCLREGEITVMDLAGRLSTQRGIDFHTVVPQGHSGHGRIEAKIKMLQESFERAQFRKSKVTQTGWQTLMKVIERYVNSIPIGYLFHQTGGNNPLLRILSPNSLRLITCGDRAPVGLFNIPDKANDLTDKIEAKYLMWYEVFNEAYLPLIMNRKKWHFQQENLVPGDIVYFKLTESKMSAAWRLGKIEDTKIGKDGFVREATVAYKDSSGDTPEDWTHRCV